eukprot:16184728-Heterocapsa_arctica.AAC.1
MVAPGLRGATRVGTTQQAVRSAHAVVIAARSAVETALAQVTGDVVDKTPVVISTLGAILRDDACKAHALEGVQLVVVDEASQPPIGFLFAAASFLGP